MNSEFNYLYYLCGICLLVLIYSIRFLVKYNKTANDVTNGIQIDKNDPNDMAGAFFVMSYVFSIFLAFATLIGFLYSIVGLVYLNFIK